MGSVFTLTGDLLAEREKSFDQVLLDRAMAWIARRKACRRRTSAFQAVRKVVCAVRQFVHSVTDGRAHVHLGVRGPTPRDPEKLGAWGVLICDLLPSADLPPEARALVAALVAKLAPLVQELLGAIEQADGARLDERFAQAELERAREDVDAELAKAVEFLRSSLRFAGQDYLVSRVLGKRRGRPRGSTKAKKEAALRKAAEERQESESAPQVAAEAGRKFDSAPASEVPGALAELQEIEQAPNWVSRAAEEIVGGLSETWSAPENLRPHPDARIEARHGKDVVIRDSHCRPVIGALRRTRLRRLRRLLDGETQALEGRVPLRGDDVEPLPRLVELSRLESPDALAAAPRAADEPGAFQDLEVLGDGLAADRGPLGETGDRKRSSAAQPAYEQEPGLVAEGGEDGRRPRRRPVPVLRLSRTRHGGQCGASALPSPALGR
jgi:hypothetical protein